MTLKAKPVIDLDSLATVAGRVTLLGKERDVLPVDGAGYHLLSQLRDAQDKEPDVKTQLEYLQAAFQLVRRLVPSLTEEESNSLNDKQVAAVIQLATGQVEALTKQIEAVKGNVEPTASKGRARR